VDFVLFLLVTAIQFVRPTDFIPGLEAVPLYLIAIIPCILLSWHKLIYPVSLAGLRERPVLVFGIGILLASIISCLAHGQFQVGVDFAVGFTKILIFYLLMLAHVNSPRRLQLFLGCLVFIIAIPTLLAVLNYHGYVTIPAFGEAKESGAIDPGTGEATGIRRLHATGNFSDPNDVCEILNCALILSLHGLFDRGGCLTRVIWLAPMALFGHALRLTQSRGGFLGAVVGLVVLFRSRFRGAKSLVIGGAALLVMVALYAGRQTSLNTSEGTGQQRIQVWNDGLWMFLRSPLIGGGIGELRLNAGYVAHNAFIQTYAELGFLCGTCLFGQYFYCLKNLGNLGSKQVTLPDPELRRLQPYLLASLASFATSEMSLTNPFGLVTYAMFGLATTFILLADPSPALSDLALTGRLVRRSIVLSGVFLVVLLVFIKLTVRY
jgi:hypothetical protein